MYKVAFLLIVLLGLFVVFLNPIAIVPDEDEHFARVITTSTGDFFPTYLEDKGFMSFQIVSDIVNNKGVNPVDSSLIESPGNFTSTYFHSIFQQNPFYGYLAQAVGILIAENSYFKDSNVGYGMYAICIIFSRICEYRCFNQWFVIYCGGLLFILLEI